MMIKKLKNLIQRNILTVGIQIIYPAYGAFTCIYKPQYNLVGYGGHLGL